MTDSMKKILATLAATLLLASLPLASALAQHPPAPTIAAKSWLLYDATSGQVIAAHEPEMRAEPASLVKIMTAYLSFAAVSDKRLALDQMVNVSQNAWKVAAD